MSESIYLPSSPINVTHFLVSSTDYPGIYLFHKHYTYPLMPSPAHLLTLTGSAHRVVHIKALVTGDKLVKFVDDFILFASAVTSATGRLQTRAILYRPNLFSPADYRESVGRSETLNSKLCRFPQSVRQH